MIKFGIARTLAIVIVSGAALCISDSAHANNGSWGGRGFGSGGSSGWSSSQGGFGSNGYASSGGRVLQLQRARPVRNLLGRVRDRISSVGCWGGSRGYGSSGGSNGGRVGFGSTGYSSCGVVRNPGCCVRRCVTTNCCSVNLSSCDGCTISGVSPINSGVATPIENQYYDPNAVVPGGGFPAEKITNPQDGIPPTPTPVEDAADGVDGVQFVPASNRQEAVLSLNVPSKARVWINGQLTTTLGKSRNYVSRQLKQGKSYKFNVKVAIDRDGKQVAMNRAIVMRAGVDKTQEFDFDKPQLTQLSLNVPADAVVKLCGNKTVAVGATRHFKTRTLLPGDSWSNYEIEVSVVRDGKTRISRRVVNIESGQFVTIDFDMDQAAGMYASK